MNIKESAGRCLAKAAAWCRARRRRILIALAVLAALWVLIHPRGCETFLVYGVDQYGSLDENGRSDAMMLVRLDHGRRRVYAVSLARDMLLEGERGGLEKINVLVRKDPEEGGSRLTDAIARNFGVQLDGWFRVNFSSLVSIVDAMDGVTLELTAEEVRYVNAHAGIWPGYPLSEGACRLCGGQALAYVRCRSLDSDLGRGRRQSLFAQAVVSRLRRLPPWRIVSLYRAMGHAWRSSLSPVQQAGLVLRGLFARRYRVERLQLPFEGYFRYGKSEHGVSGILLDFEDNRRLLQEAFGGSL